MTLEAACADRDKKLAGFRQGLRASADNPANAIVPGWRRPNYADYIVLGAFMWARSTSLFKILEQDDPVAVWRTRLLDRFEVTRMAPGYDT